MSAVTQTKLQSDLAKDSQKSSSDFSVPRASDLAEGLTSHGNIFRTPTLKNKKTERFVAGLNKMNLDLSKHPTANELINLPQESVDDLAGEYTKRKNTEAKELRKIEEDVGRLKAKSEELNKDKERLRKKLDYTCQELNHTQQELDQTRERLVNSREEYTAMEK